MADVLQWGVDMPKVKIRVLKTICFKELAMNYGHSDNYHSCPVFQEGDEFITEDPFGNKMPEGFCHMAWQSLFMPVSVLAGGGKVLGIDDKHIVCCNDGLRPVIFELSREEEE